MSQGGQTGGNAYSQAANALTGAGAGAQTEMGFQPAMVSGTGYTAGQVGSTNLSPYMNPYTQNVVNTTLSDLDRQRQMAQQQNRASAAAAGAFGGSRQGLVEAETNRGFADVAARTAAGLQQQGFLNAQQMAGQDIAAANRAAEFGATQGMNAALANQQMGLAGSQQRLGAGAQLANLGASGFNMANTLQQQQAQQGLLQQQMQQQLLNDAMQQFYGYANSPLAYLNTMNSALSGSPLANQRTGTSSYKPGVLDYLSFGTGLMAL
jgi:hypothetical protein